MATNYFRPITYLPRQPTKPPVQLPTTSTGANPFKPNQFTVTNFEGKAAPNQGMIQSYLAKLYGDGKVPGLNEVAAGKFGKARNDLRDNLRGYGGFSFRQDDPNTKDVDESLMVDYAPDKLGRNERQAVLAARAQANARGMISSGFGDQLVGAALQRVGEQARQIVNQYSQQIGQISDYYFDPNTGLQEKYLGEINSLYGADTTWQTEQEALRPPPPPPPPPAAPAPTPAQAAGNPAQFLEVANSGAYGSLAWTGKRQPNMATIRARHPGMITTTFRGPDGKYRVYVRPA